ncbi:MAG: hypothetical protein QM731_06830 [Chitinophagaceae bacterium]
MNSLALPIVHPGFENLKRSGRVLHFAAAGLILAHAISHFSQPHSSPLYLGCLLLIAVDIFILVFAGGNILTELPRVNLFFRLVEFLFFLGIGITMFFEKKWLLGSVHVVLSSAYCYLLYCEKKANTEEFVAIHHTGVSIPALPENKFLIWSQVDHIDAYYDSITINTTEKTYQFDLRKNLAFEEMDQIHEFCRHYLGS